jgi:hypothetical protein
MPTPSVIRENVLHRTHINIGLGEAVRLARDAAGRHRSVELAIHGRDVRTGAPAEAVLSVGELLSAPPLPAADESFAPRPP